MTGIPLLIRILLIVVLLYTITMIMQRIIHQIKKQHLRNKQRIAMEANRIDNLPPPQTQRLNSRFFGGKEERQPRSKKPETALPIVVMPRVGRKFTGKNLEFLISKFGLQYSPNKTYEIIANNQQDIFCTMINIFEPGTFPPPESLENYEFNGMLFILQLPVSDDPVADWETFYAVVSEIADSCNGRLCNHNRRPLGNHDIALYHQAAEEFEQQYLKWQNEVK